MKATDTYNNWKKNINDKYLKNILTKMTKKDIEECFGKNLKFGTGGLRAKMGAGPNRLNIYTIRKNTEGYARWIDQQVPISKEKGVVIAYDNRFKSQEFAYETAKVLANHHIKTYLFSSLRTTPELSFAIRYLKAFGGVVITASHNPPEYNGYKIYDETGCQCVLRYTDEIIKYINTVENELDVKYADKNLGKKYIKYIDKTIDEAYYKEVLKIQLHPEMEKNIQIVYSPQHGTGNIPVNEVLSRAGYTVIPVENQSFPSETFENTENPNPESDDAFNEAIKVALKNKADCIICTDPDCDRLGVMIKNKDNDYNKMTGNQVGAIILEYLIKERKKLNIFPDNPIVYSTVVTSSLTDLICKKYDIEIDKTLTGFKFIGDKIHDIEISRENNFLFGYEESYGYLISDIVRDKDGVQSCLIIAEIINYYKNKGLTLDRVLDNIYNEYGYYSDGQISIKLNDGDDRLVDDIMNSIRMCHQFEGNDILAKEDYLTGIRTEGNVKSKIELPKSNVVKLFFENNSWIAVRPSGTEPKIKFYYFQKDGYVNFSKLINEYINHFE